MIDTDFNTIKDLKVATMGRISKKDIAKVLDGKLSKVERIQGAENKRQGISCAKR